MKQRLKTTLLATLVGASIFGMTSGAQAARDGCMMDGPRAMQRQMNPEQLRQRALLNAEYRLARLELALQINDHQRTAWSSFRTAMLQRAKLRFEQREARQNASIARTAIERLQRKEEKLKQDAEHLAHTRNAVETLFRQLNEAQKAVFNNEFSLDGGMKPQRMARAYGDGWRAGARTEPGVPPAVGVVPDVAVAVNPGIPPAVGVVPGVAVAVKPGIPPAVGVVPDVAVAVNPGIPPAVGRVPEHPGLPPAIIQHNAGMGGVPLNEHGLPQEDAMPAVGGENANQPPSR